MDDHTTTAIDQSAPTLDKCAEELYGVISSRPVNSWQDWTPWGGLRDDEKEFYREAARACIGALLPVSDGMIRAASEDRARDDEGEFEPLCDLLDFSGENKTRTVVRSAITAALTAVLGEKA